MPENERSGRLWRQLSGLAAIYAVLGATPLPAVPSAAPSPEMRSDAPSIGTFGFDTTGMDRAVRPGDDFVQFAVGRWIETAAIPPDRSSLTSVSVIKTQATQRLREIIEAARAAGGSTGSDLRRVGDYFRAFMDEERIERLGLTPVAPQLAAIASIRTRNDLSKALGASIRTAVDLLNVGDVYTPHFMSLQVAADLDDARIYRPYLLQGGLGMPDREYYLSASSKFVELRAKYQQHVAAMLRLAGYPDPEGNTQRILALEMAIARVHVSVADSYDISKSDTVWRRADLDTRAPGLDWTAFLTAAGIDRQPRFGAIQPSALAGLSKLAATEPLESWKAYLTFHTIDEAAPFLSKALVDEAFAFNGRAIGGAPEIAERWRRGVDFSSAALGDAVGKLYVAKYFPASIKAQVQTMVGTIKTAFTARIDRLDWMGPATKAEARRKVASLLVMVGYPDHWRDYSGLRIDPRDAYGNWRRTALFEYRRNLAKLGRPVDRSEWFMSPQTVNGGYTPSLNAVALPAAILAPTFFDPHADPAVNYGALGAGLGHEVSHGFDDNGAQFDSKGNLRNWWTPQDLAHFKAEGRRLAEQVSAYEPLPGLHINGEQTSMEDIADVAGLATAWDAYQASTRGKPAVNIDGFTPAQRFFLGFAQNYRGKFREAALRRQIVGDVLPPVTFRILTVRNLDAWYAAFDVTPGQKLYLAPADRVRIW